MFFCECDFFSGAQNLIVFGAQFRYDFSSHVVEKTIFGAVSVVHPLKLLFFVFRLSLFFFCLSLFFCVSLMFLVFFRFFPFV